MNEWQFTSDVAKWITRILDNDKDLPFGEAYCEGQSADSPKRRDLTIKDRFGRIVLTGEVKLPGKKDGATPYNVAVVADARSKAQRAQSKFFFTWNVNECVLWETDTLPMRPRPDYKKWHVVNIYDAKFLDNPNIQAQIQKWLTPFLHDVADALRGASVIQKKSPDEKFIDALEAALSTPIAVTLDALYEQYRKESLRQELDKWMREELGFTIVTDPDGIHDNLDSAAKHSCYTLANKLVFYEALLKRYGPSLQPLNIPEHIVAADTLRTHLEGFFAEAKSVTHDYETVFGENAFGLGNRLPFYSDGVVDFWRAFVEEIHEFDFSRLDYEVIGNIFERLISPDERHKYGQFYTRVEVVDLINSFAIRTGEETVMDPACGGGTFLVRAYARKRELAPQHSHSQRLRDLYGVDISRFATNLTTINLATRDLIDDENYPQVARDDFLATSPFSTFVSLPHKISATGLGPLQQRDVQIPLLDAIVGNPPYIRQEDIPMPLKDRYQFDAKKNDAKLSKRSDIHCYFWPHSISFLKEDGYLCFLTSSQWLDTDYGFKLQEWILRHFALIAVLESIDEPWFIGARVVTTATVLRRQSNRQKRMDNVVRFIQLRQPLANVFAHDGTTAGAVLAADRFRDELFALQENTRNARYRARLVHQSKLWNDGVRLGAIIKKTVTETDEIEDMDFKSGEYFGGKWGIPLRAPDLWFDLIELLGKHLVPLSEVVEIRRGITSGKDTFFFPKDASSEALKIIDPNDFRVRYGIDREEVINGSVKIVRCGESYEEMRPIEAHFLEPEVHSLMEVNGYIVSPKECSRMILLIPSGSRESASYIDQYINWGEAQGVNQGSTVKGHMTQEREWYDLTGHKRGAMFWSKSQQYRHSVPLNEHNLICNCNLYDIHVPDTLDPMVLAGILNSSIVVFSKYQYGRPVGVEGNLKTEIVDVGMMLIPDPRSATATHHKHIADAFFKMKNRPILGFLSEHRLRRMSYIERGKEADLAKLSDETELTQADRRELDHAVLEMMGVSSRGEREQIINSLYAYLAEYFEWTRQKEEKAIHNKKRAARRKTVRPAELVREIFSVIEKEHGALMRTYRHFIDLSQPFDTYEVPVEGSPERLIDLFHQHAVHFADKKASTDTIIETRNDPQRDLLLLLAENGIRGFVRVPFDEEGSRRTLTNYGRFIKERAEILRILVEDRTADPVLQDSVYKGLLRRIQSN